jgi:hypothetical protein
MKNLPSFPFTIFLLLLLIAFSACSTAGHFPARRYMPGQYRDGFGWSVKADETQQPDSTRKHLPDSLAIKMREAGTQAKMEVMQSLQAGKTFSSLPYSDALSEYYPVLSAKMDSALVRTQQNDTSWIHDTLMPACVEVAFGSQATMAMGTVGGLITMAAPGTIWIFWLPMALVPVSLLVSLICAGIAATRISTGQIDKKYWKAMRLWSLCLLLNMAIGAIVIIHYSALL